MPLTQITVIYGVNGLVDPGTGQPATGSITLQPVAETPGSTYTVIAKSVTFALVNGQINPAANTLYTNGQAFQALITEEAVGTDNPPPYVVSVPASGTLDLSTAPRGTLAVTTPLYIPVSLVTTVGDLIVGTGNATVARLPVGANGLVLTADSTKPDGLAWEAAGAGTVTSVAAGDGTIVIGGTPTVTPTVRVGTITESQVTNLTTDLAGKIPASTVTTKGDVLAATGSAALTRLGVGSDGQVLTAASGQATGLTWQTPAVPNIQSGFITSGNVSAVNTGGAWAAIAGMSKPIPAVVGERLTATFNFSTLNMGASYFDVGVIGSGSAIVRQLYAPVTPPTQPDSTYEGMPAAIQDPNVHGVSSEPPYFTATSTDIVGGNVTFCLLWKSGGTGTFLCNAAVPVSYVLKNFH